MAEQAPLSLYAQLGKGGGSKQAGKRAGNRTGKSTRKRRSTGAPARPRPRPSGSAAWTPCLLCGRLLLPAEMGLHLDTRCPKATPPPLATAPRAASPEPPAPPPPRTPTLGQPTTAAAAHAAPTTTVLTMPIVLSRAHPSSPGDGGRTVGDPRTTAGEGKRRRLSGPGEGGGGVEGGKEGSTLHTYFGGTDPTVPQFFVLQWPKRAFFARRVPPSCRSLGLTFKWKQAGKEIVLCSNIPSQAAPCLPGETGYRNVPFLKSHLQKCVRKCQSQLALATAAHLARLDLLQLLRRLPVIMAEDGLLHWQHFPILTWLMAAVSKQYHPPRAMVDWLLGLAEGTAVCRKREIFYGLNTGPVNLEHVQTRGLDEEARAFLYSIQVRRSFGGMQGDLRMLDSAFVVWLARLKGKTPAQYKNETAWKDITWKVRPRSLQKVPLLPVAKWDLSAIDQHCSNIDEQLGQRVGMAVPRLRSLIWQCSSSTNLKENVPYSTAAPAPVVAEADKQLWETQCKAAFLELARAILQRRH